jgi:hypothetical protein
MIRARKVAAIWALSAATGLLTAGPIRAQAKSPTALTLIAASALLPNDGARLAPRADPAKVLTISASDQARQIVGWVIETDDNHGMPFIVVDKKHAQVFVFNGDARLLGETSALLGLARGDDSAPGIGIKKLSDIRPEERTTPAGRFVASLGYGLGKQDILWVDYDSALALHRVSPKNSEEHRLQRLASNSPFDRRVTFGCINVSNIFYDAVIHPTFSGTSGVVYIMPEVKSLAEVFTSSAPSGVKSSSAADDRQYPMNN